MHTQVVYRPTYSSWIDQFASLESAQQLQWPQVTIPPAVGGG